MNSMLKIDGKSVFYKEWYNKGIFTIKDMLDRHGKLYSYESFVEIFNIRAPFTIFGGIKNLILTKFPALRDNIGKEIGPNQPKFISIICKDKRGSKSIYNIFLNNLEFKVKAETKWQNILNLEENFHWKGIYNNIFINTNDTKLI